MLGSRHATCGQTWTGRVASMSVCSSERHRLLIVAVHAEYMQRTSRRRIAFYSHDTQGLGHIRRNIALAAALVADEPSTDVLLITGAPQATALPLPPHTEVVTVPTVTKGADGGYAAGTFEMPLARLLELRSGIIASALISYRPDLVIVDKVPRGLDGELVPALEALVDVSGHTTGRRPRVVLGLRDILDDPITTRQEWREQGSTEAVDTYYDEIWVYGDRAVLDVATEYRLPARVAAKMRYTGYLADGRDEARLDEGDGASAEPVPHPFVLCLVGGGQDGYPTADAFARSSYPDGHTGVLITGPYMAERERAALARVAEAREDLVVRELVTDTHVLLRDTAAVVTMGGYNSVCEALASRRPTLVVPRIRPRVEQLVRADRLSRLGLVDAMAPQALDPTAVTAWLADAVAAGSSQGAARVEVALDGLARVPGVARRTLSTRLAPTRPRREEMAG